MDLDPVFLSRVQFAFVVSFHIIFPAFTIGLAGTVTPTGGLVKAIGKPLTGSTTPTGSLAKAVSKPLGGSVTPTGTLTLLRFFALSLADGSTVTGWPVTVAVSSFRR